MFHSGSERWLHVRRHVQRRSGGHAKTCRCKGYDGGKPSKHADCSEAVHGEGIVIHSEATKEDVRE